MKPSLPPSITGMQRTSLPLNRFICLLLCFFVTASTSLAQSSGKISGLVQQSDTREAGGTTVTLLKSDDSALIKVTVSDKSGYYEFDNIREGQYQVSFTLVGFKKKQTDRFTLPAGGFKLHVPL